MSGAPCAKACAARVSRRARKYFMTGQPVVLPKALARCERETPHASATAGKLSSPDELRSMTHKALATTDMQHTVAKPTGCAFDHSSARNDCAYRMLNDRLRLRSGRLTYRVI